MTKTYVSPGRVCPELVIVPSGLKDLQGNKRKREAVIFRPNVTNTGEFTTSDPKLIEFIENHGWFKTGRIIIMGESDDIRHGSDKPDVSVGVKTTETQQPKAPSDNKGRGKGVKIKK